MTDPYQQALADYNAAYKWIIGRIVANATPEDGRTFEAGVAAYEQRFALFKRFLATVGNPQQAFKSVHIAGTSGKGSVTTMISALLQACALRVGDHVSPYLQIPNEKLRTNSKMISPSEFAALVEDFKPMYQAWIARGEELPYALVWMTLNFQYFARQQVDWAVVETSVGGRLDSTNVLPSEIAVITNVDIDHTAALGAQLEQIAWHKCGIIKQDGIAVTAETKPDALAVFEREAQEKNATLYQLDYQQNPDQTFDVTTPYNTYRNCRVGLKGSFQRENAALAITAVDLLANQHGFTFGQAEIDAALPELAFTGRAELVQTTPPVILDGAHNPAKIASLVSSLKAEYADYDLTVIYGMLLAKDANDSLLSFKGYCENFIFVEPHVYRKPAYPHAALATAAKDILPTAAIRSTEYVADALETALAEATAKSLIVVTGSLYLLGEARERWYPKDALLRALEAG